MCKSKFSIENIDYWSSLSHLINALLTSSRSQQMFSVTIAVLTSSHNLMFSAEKKKTIVYHVL